LGDAAEMAMIELVDFNTTYSKEKAGTAAKKTRRTRKSGGAKKTDEAASASAEPAAE
jgi:large subunit ribosomal protein L17